MNFATGLPAPAQKYEVFRDYSHEKHMEKERNKHTSSIPPYGRRRQDKFIPRNLEDFGDGGAYPEIHVAQYPLKMGMSKGAGANAAGVVPVTVEAGTGIVEYDAIVNQGRREGQSIQTKFTDLIESNHMDGEVLERPDEEEEQKIAEETRNALMKIVNQKVALARPVKHADPNASKNIEGRASYIRYTPRENAPGYNPAVKQRIIRMVEAQIDPMEPPKFKHKKVPRGPPSPPVPVMHSPPRKITVKDQQSWKIPPCVSNWKNARGYTIPLDKRLAADGRSLQEVTINGKFAKLAESLYIAERSAREEVEMRNALVSKARQSAKRGQEDELRRIAQQARKVQSDLGGGDDAEQDDPEAAEARSQRDELRAERKRERERDLRLEAKGKRSKTQRDQDRDVSERIALGMPTGNQKRETQYDSRLFNQTQGMDSGFGQDDSYNLYNKPLFDRSTADTIYRPRKSDGDAYGTTEEHYDKIKKHGERFKPDRDFEGVDRARGSGPRKEPVQFERRSAGDGDEELDPFGLDSFLSEAKKGKKGSREILQKRPGRGTMAAGGGSRKRDGDDEGSGRSSIGFSRGSDSRGGSDRGGSDRGGSDSRRSRR